MRLDRLTIAGFRGFNEERSIAFHDRLTVISAPNSHGKTSISEALEFLLYGVTSKVSKAGSKEEYKNSYRNRHFPPATPAYIEAVFSGDGGPVTLRTEISADETASRFCNGAPVERWPFHDELTASAKPFVLQHALTYLLLTTPAERFQGFAQLLGLDDVDDVFRALLGLCTKASSSIPPAAQLLLRQVETFELRLDKLPTLKAIASALRKGLPGVRSAYEKIEMRAEVLLANDPNTGGHLSRLTAARDAASAKVFSGTVAIRQDPNDAALLVSHQSAIANVFAQSYLEDYGRLCGQGLSARLQKEAELLNLGVGLLEETPGVCPLCTQSLSDSLAAALHERHVRATESVKNDAGRADTLRRVTEVLKTAQGNLDQHRTVLLRPVSELIKAFTPENESKVADLLGGRASGHFRIATESAEVARSLAQEVDEAASSARIALLRCTETLRTNAADLVDAESAATRVQLYLAASSKLEAASRKLVVSLAAPAQALNQAVDALAGTEEMTLLIDLLSARSSVERALAVRDTLESLKDLKRHVEQVLAETMDAAMSTDLTSSVMAWYSKIKTVGDPDVHFSGFGMERTKAGDFKSRRLTVKAESYGAELASAVSSLSESKLNALGLCVSIAGSIRRPGPWSFLIIDDPIQSWDDEHETQFIDIMRTLIEVENKQIVVLSHKSRWADQVCAGCRSLNGYRYDMTGYTQQGPHVQQLNWSPIEERLREAEGIANDATATSVRLQQAEEELRLAACQIAAIVAKNRLSRTTSPHSMNKSDVRSILVSAGIAADAVDRVSAIFVNADDAHHTPKNYQPNVQRIRRAIQSLRDLYKGEK